MKHLILIILFLFSVSLTNAQKSDIEKMFDEINASIEMGEIKGVLDHLEDGGSKTETLKNKFENLLKLDSLSYSLELNEIIINKDTAVAIVFETKSYNKYKLNNTEVNWQKFTLINHNSKWQINNIEDQSYLQADYVRIDTEFEPDKKTMTGKEEIKLKIVEGGENNILFWINRGLNVDSITDDKGNDVFFKRDNLAIIIPWLTTFKGGEEITLSIEYSGTFFNEFEQFGYSLVNIGEQGCFANFVTQWYPKVNGTLTKAKAELNYTVPEDFTVASVGKLIGTKDMNGRVTYSYRVNTPMDYTFNANKFYVYNDVIDGIQVNVYFLSGNKEKAKLYAENAMKLISFLKELYGVFPYDSYTISEVPSEITKALGGSGGQGLNFYPTGSLRDDVFEFPLIAHEVGHMWWGSWILNNSESGSMIGEGFSQLNAALCYKHFYGEKEMWNFLREGTGLYPQSAKSYFSSFGNEEDDMPIGIYDENKASSFDRLAYFKSHFVYAMLMETIGYDAFIKGIKRIILDYGNKHFDLQNLQEIMELESGMDLNYFFQQWIYRAGAPEFQFNYSVVQLDDGRYEVSGSVKQLRELFKVTAEIEIVRDDSRDIYKLDIDGKETDFSYIIDYNPKAVVFDGDYKILRWTEDFKNLYKLRTGIEQTFIGKNNEAVKTLNEFLLYSPHDIDAYTFLGIAYFNLENYEKAKKYLQFVIHEYETNNNINHGVVFSYLTMGKLFETIGETDKAILYFKKILELPNISGSRLKAFNLLDKIEKR